MAQEDRPAKLVQLLEEVLAGVLGSVGGLFFLVTLMFFFVAAIPGFGPRIAALNRLKPELASALGRFVNGTQHYLS